MAIEFGAPLFGEAALKIIIELLEQRKRHRGGKNVINQAIHATARDFRSEHGLEGLEKQLLDWCDSEEFEDLFRDLASGTRQVDEESLTRSFLDITDFYASTETDSLAARIVSSFIHHLVTTIYQSHEGLPALGERLETLHEGLQDNIEELKESIQLDLTRAMKQAEIDRFFIRIDEDFLKIQKGKEVKKVLGILGNAVGEWPMIAKDLDLRRDLQKEIMPLLDGEREGASLLMILGEPGAGKTTLLRRMGKDLALSGRPVFELNASTRMVPKWFSAINLIGAQFERPVVLINDIFRFEGIMDILSDPTLACTIIATSRTNENLSRNIPDSSNLEKNYIFRNGKLEWPVLGSPSREELKALRQRAECSKMSERKWKQLTSVRQGKKTYVPPLLVIMLQLAGGKPFDQIVSSTVQMLKEKHPETHRAFGIICAFHSLGMSTPSSIIDMLLDSRHFISSLKADVEDEKREIGARGIIFKDDDLGYEEAWRSSHELIAETAMKSEYSGLLEAYCEHLIEVSDPSEVEQNLFLARLANSLNFYKKKKIANKLMHKYSEKIDSLVNENRELQVFWASFFDFLDDKDRVNRCLLTAEPGTPTGAFKMMTLLMKYDKEGSLAIARGLLDKFPDNSDVRGKYLEVVEHYGSDKDLRSVIRQTRSWLEVRTEDATVPLRHAYLNLLKKKGSTRNERSTAIRDTYKWLEGCGARGNLVHVSLLKLIESKGTPEEVISAIQHVREWLDNNVENSTVRERYLSLVETAGTKTDIREAIETTKRWLEKIEDDANVRVRYLSLVEKKGTETDINEALEDTNAWLERHDDNTNVRESYLCLVRNKATNEGQVNDAVEQTYEWLHENDGDINTRINYIKIIGIYGTRNQIEKTNIETWTWLEANAFHEGVLMSYLILLKRRGTRAQKESVTRNVFEWWKNTNVKNTGVTTALLQLAADSEEDGMKRELASLAESRAQEEKDYVKRFILSCCATLYESCLDPGEVRKKYEQALSKRNFNYAHSCFSFARFLFKQEEYSEANKFLMMTFDYNPCHFAGMLLWADLLRVQGKTSQAENFLKYLIDNRFMRKALLCCQLASLLMENGRIAEAREYLNQAMTTAPAFGKSYMLMAEMEAMEGRQAEVRRNIRDALKFAINLDFEEEINLRAAELLGA